MKTRRSLIIVMLAALTMSIAALFFGFQPNTTAHAETTISNTTITADTTWVADTKLSGNIVIKSGVTVTLTGKVRVTQDSSVVISGGGTIKRGNEDAYLNLPQDTNLTFNNVTLDGAKIAAKQPMIFNANPGASLTIKNCTIKNCITTDSQAGGVIRLWQTTLSIDNTTIKDCSGKYYGAIKAMGYGANYAPVSISNSKFYNNSATGARYSAATGGAIYLNLTSTEITNCEFRNNFTQNGSGGAIAVSESTLTLNSGIFTDNVADDLYEDSYSGNGGAISISGSSSVVNVYGGYFLNNKSKGALSDIYSYSNATLNVNLKNLPTREGYTFSGWTDSEGNTYPVSQFTVTGKNTDLVAKWDANKYKISYSGMDKATLSPKPEQHTYGTDTKISNPAKTGYTFKGWKVNGKSPAVKNLTLGATAYKSDISLEATWTVNQYQVTLDRQSGSGGTSSATATYDAAMPAITLPSRTGYTFQGYFAKPKGAGKQYYDKNGNSAATCDFYVATTLYAHWQANTYTIKYMKNKPSKASHEVSGSTASSSHTYDQSKALTANGYSLTGWHFRGWAKTATGTAEYTDGASVKNLTSANGSTVILYAVWQANTYTIVYNSNKPESASGSITETMPQVTHTYDTAKNLSDNQFTLTGWHFCGWAKTATGAAEYTNGQKINNLTDKDGGTVALFAVWQAKTYTIKFNTDGGNFVQETSATFDSALPNAGVPARKGYRFCGYFSQAGGKGVQFYDASGKAAENKTYAEDRNIELYAYWSVISYNIDLYSGGRYVKTLENVAFDNLRLPSAAALNLSREHYNFVGWNLYDNQDWKMFSADVVYTVGIGYEQGETVTLYAAWKEKNVYSVNYDANGGGGAPGVEQKHEDETFALSDTIPTRENYTFLGWARTPDANLADYPAGFVNKLTMGGEPITLYAVWKRNPSLSFDANGGAFSSAPEIRYPATGSEESIPSAAPEKAGHIFAGWSDEKDASIADYPADGSKKITMPDADTVLYAVWQKQKYTITHAVASSDFEIIGLLGEYEYESAATFTIQTAASATGKPLVYVNGELLSAKNGEYTFTVRGESHVFVAAADGSALTLVYSANGGTGAPYDNHVYQSGDTATILPTTPTRYGYTFLGWAAEQNAEAAQYKKGETYTFAGVSAVLYAVWKANAYTVVYNANGGAGDMQNGEFTFGTKGALAKNSFAKIGYTFVGWSLSQNGAAAYKDGAEIADLCADENGLVTLYAVWEQTVTQISFDAEGGKENNGTLSVAYGEELTGEKLTFPTRSGYKFAGYFTQRGGAGEEIFDAALNAVASNGWNKNLTALTLYAGWQPISYTIVYMNGADKVKSQTAVYDTSFNLLTAAELAITPSQAYHHFAGWTTAPSGQVVMYADGQKISDPLSATDGEEVIFYAVFAENEKYSVLYNANGGSNAPVDANTYYAGETVTFSTVKPEKEGYNFEGWSFDPNGGALIHAETVMQEGGITLYAVWQAGETLTAQINAVKSANASLKTALDSLTGTVTGENGLTEKIADLLTRMNAAESTLNSLGATYATIAALNTEINTLKSTLAAADTALSDRISAVDERLTAETGNLTNLISRKANQSDFASLKEAFDNAKTLLDSEIETRGKKDAELAAKIAALQSSYDTLSQELTDEIQKVTDTIQAKVKELTVGKEDKTALMELS